MNSVYYSKIVNFLKSKDEAIFKNILRDFCFLETSEGRNNKNVALRLFFIDGNKQDVIFRHSVNLGDQKKTEYEYKKLKYLDGRSAPRPYYFSHGSKNIFKRNVLILEYIDGLLMKPRFFTRPELKFVAQTLYNLHKIHFDKPSNALEFPPTGVGDFKSVLLNEINDLEKFFLQTEVDYKNKILEIFNYTQKILLPHIKKIGSGKFSFVHGDLRNHFIKKDGRFYLIDWEDSRAGDPAEDIAHFLYFNKLHRDYKKYFVNHYIQFNNKTSNQDIIERTKIYIILEEFFGLMWAWEQMDSRCVYNEKYYYKNLFKLRYKNLVNAFRFFSKEDYYLLAGHLHFL